MQERFTRKDHNDLSLTVTMDDPKIYTKPFMLGTDNFRWIPNQEMDEWLCHALGASMEYLQDDGLIRQAAIPMRPHNPGRPKRRARARVPVR